MRLRLLSFLFVAVVLFPAPASAASLFESIVPQSGACTCINEAGERSAPDWGCSLTYLQNVINTGVALAVVVIILSLMYAGFILIIRSTSPASRTQARNVVLNSVLGLVIILGAWLVVDFVMKIVYDRTAVYSGTLQLGPWNSIWSSDGNDMCLVIRDPEPITSGTIAIIFSQDTPGGGSVGPGGGAAGSCTVPTSGPCSPANLQAFGAVASQAAQICTAESGGNPQNLSRTDVTADGRAYSVGLFQINLTNSFTYRVNGRNCSEAFSAPCQGRAVTQSGSRIGRCTSRVTNPALYNQCVAAAQTPSINIAAARDLYDGDWGRWSTARTCRLPR